MQRSEQNELKVFNLKIEVNFSDFCLLSMMSDFRADKLMNIVEEKLKTHSFPLFMKVYVLECTIDSMVFTWSELLLL